jgi:c-di-AMP phosphodiesterase-like protein
MKKKYKLQILLAGVSSAFIFGVILIYSAIFFTAQIWLCSVIAVIVFGAVNFTWVRAIAKKSQADPLDPGEKERM